MNYDFTLKLKEVDTKDIYIFNEALVETPNEALNSTLAEKVRRFNNSLVPLMRQYYNLNNIEVNGKPLVEVCNDTPNEIDQETRILIRGIIMELFILREKVNNLLCSIFFIKQEKNFVMDTLPKLYNISEDFPKLKKVLDYLKALSDNKDYKFIMKMRNDEIHNMSIIDSFNYEIKLEGGKILIINHGYRIKVRNLYESITNVICYFYNIKNMLQDILDDTIVNIHSLRKRINKYPIYVNINEEF